MKSHPYLDSIAHRGSQLRLEPIKAAMQELGNPQEFYKSVIVTGTNGKGSVAAMIANGLENAGMYTSPHLSELNERIAVNGVRISDPELMRLIKRVQPIAEHHRLTVFEVLTAVAFIHFAERKVDHAVLEVGMGGRLDATNIVRPAVSVITNVELDHTLELGNTIEKIAEEKAGIIHGGTVVTSEKKPNALAVIKFHCDSTGAQLVEAQRQDFSLTLKGGYQQDNAACAYEALRMLGKSDADARRAVETARWPGRLEQIGHVLLDGAHNPAGIAALAEYLKGKDFALVLAVKKDKDYNSMAEIICPMARKVYVTEYTDGPEPLPAAWLVNAVKKHAHEYDVVPDAEEALARAVKGGFTVVTGSLYLVGQLRSRLAA